MEKGRRGEKGQNKGLAPAAIFGNGKLLQREGLSTETGVLYWASSPRENLKGRWAVLVSVGAFTAALTRLGARASPISHLFSAGGQHTRPRVEHESKQKHRLKIKTGTHMRRQSSMHWSPATVKSNKEMTKPIKILYLPLLES